MCTVLLAWRCYPDSPIVLAANRDEQIGRPSAQPRRLLDDPPLFGGTDLLAGGTWLAVAQDGRLCAVTNRRTASGGEVQRDSTRRSRGEIPVTLLRAREDEVPHLLATFGPGIYNPVNVLYASEQRAWVASIDDAGPPRIAELAPGLHVLTVGDVDDLTRAKDAALRAALRGALDASPTADALESRLRTILADHHSPSGDPLDAVCIHGDTYGTVSASTVIAGAAGVRYRHAPGRPCVTPFAGVDMGGAAPSRD
jgi:uncharacterized protein with NRDE domain